MDFARTSPSVINNADDRQYIRREGTRQPKYILGTHVIRADGYIYISDKNLTAREHETKPSPTYQIRARQVLN